MSSRDDRQQGPRFLQLLMVLGLLFLLYPVAVEIERGRMFRFVFLFLLATSVVTIGQGRRRRMAALIIVIPTALAQIAVLAFHTEAALLVATVTSLTFVVWATSVVLYEVLKGGKVTREKIAGAVCGYLLLGLAWAHVYGITGLVQPGAFSLPADLQTGDKASAVAEYGFIYYSFVTLTTLGYGEISPVAAFARTFAWIEAVTGQLYLAILIARLVALELTDGDRDLE